MGFDDKMDSKIEQGLGKLKEGAGDMTDDEELETEGQMDQAKGGLKEGWENIKDAGRDATR